MFYQEIGVKPIRNLFKNLVTGRRDSLERPIESMIIYLNINQGGNWAYNRAKDLYEDRMSGRLNRPDEIKYRL